MLFTILVEETLAKEVEVEAGCEKEAIEKADKMYMDGEIKLDCGDFTGNVDITAREE